MDGRFHIPLALLDKMERNLEAWRRSHFDEKEHCFFQSDTWDGGEDSISGGGCRVSINSVMVGCTACIFFAQAKRFYASKFHHSTVLFLRLSSLFIPEPNSLKCDIQGASDRAVRHLYVCLGIDCL